MHLIHPSKSSFAKYQADDAEVFFNNPDSNGGYYTTNKCNWKPHEFYLAKNFTLTDCCVSFASKSLISVAEKLNAIKLLDRSIVIQMSEDESFLDAYMFNMNINENGAYSFDGLLLEINVDEDQIIKLIEAINEERWSQLKVSVFFDEVLLLQSLREAEASKFFNYSLRIKDFCISC